MIIDRVGKNKFIQKMIKKTEDKKIYNKLNHHLPLIESGCTTMAYVAVTQLNNKIPEDRKPALIWQSLIGGAVGIAVSKKLDDYVKGHAEKLCKELEKYDNMPKMKNTLSGIRILLPIAITTLVLRYGVSVLSVPLSSKITQVQNKIQGKKVDKLA